MLGFQVSIDPSDVFNEVFDPCLEDKTSCDLLQAYGARRTFFTFTGQNGGSSPEPTILASYYRTIFGHPVRLWPVGADEAGPDVLPARLVFTRGELTADGSEAFHLAPEGDFLLEVLGIKKVPGTVADGSYDLLCGLHGDEFLRFASKTATSDGDRLRFLSRRPAFAPKYPFSLASPVEAPAPPNASLLDTRFLTSWATLVRGEDTGILPYAAQPQGAALFGKDELIQPVSPHLLGHVTPVNHQPVDPNLLFPLLPYAGVKPGNDETTFSKEQIEAFEREVIAPTRRSAIGAMTARLAASSQSSRDNPAVRADLRDFTTPSGVIVTLSQGDSRWSKILLGQNTLPRLRQMYFSEPDEELVQAFQTNQLFLVIANATHLGQLVGEGETVGQAFSHRMVIEDWVLQADVGQHNRYGDYNNVIIVKGRRGRLYDPQRPKAENLIANPEQWSQRAAFAAPTTIDHPDLPDQNQLVILSQWLQDFFQDASDQSDHVLFEHFNRIARDENWTGILILKMQIQQVPDNLKGITSGLAHPDAFFAHHFGIEISQVKIDEQGATLKDASSMFGLISYIDPDYDPTHEKQPVPSLSGQPYDFRILTLQVLFENTAIKQFRSYAQLTLNEFFGTAVDHMGEGGNPYNALVLRGSYQNNNGQQLYSLSSVGTGVFYLKSNVLNKVEVTTAQMSTRNPASENITISWFALNGFLDYRVLQQTQAGETAFFDLFSFGNQPGVELPRKGLSFANLGIQMTLALAQSQPSFAFRAEEITFDLATSTPRPGSLLTNFTLQLQGLASGDKETTPAKAGYVPVIPDFRLGGVDGGSWYGLRFRLAMGTPGELAGKVGLNSYLLAAWSPDSTGEASYRAMVGLELPGASGGAKLISLQTVLKLSLGQIRLIYVKEQQSFLLLFTEIALRFLGLLKIPPNGSTLFYLFGNPRSEGKPSGLGWYAMYTHKKTDKMLDELEIQNALEG